MSTNAAPATYQRAHQQFSILHAKPLNCSKESEPGTQEEGKAEMSSKF
jgi:hypothetical protein